MAGRPHSLRAVRELLFTSVRIACTPWRANYMGRAPLNEDAENAFLRVVAAWESFLSEWTIGVVVRNPSVFAGRLATELDDWIAKKYGMSQQQLQQSGINVALKAALSLPQPSYEDLRRLLDPRGRNIEFDSMHDFAKYSTQMTAQPFAGRASAALPIAGGVNVGIVEAASAMRNWLTHGSLHARETLRERLAALTDPELHSADLPSSAGRYLKGWHAGPAIALPDWTGSAQAAGAQAPTQNYERRRMLRICAEYVRIAWVLVPIDET